MVDSWQSAVCGAFAGAKDYMLSWEMLKKKGGEEGEMCKSVKASSAATFLYNSSLLRREKMAVVCGRENRRGGGGER